MALCRSAVLLAVPLALPACSRDASETRPPALSSAASLSSLIGVSEADLVRRLGPPTRSFESPKGRYVVYERTDIWRTGHRLPATFSCRTTFILDAGHVWSFDRTGAGCD
jgi:hypothetical protein